MDPVGTDRKPHRDRGSSDYPARLASSHGPMREHAAQKAMQRENAPGERRGYAARLAGFGHRAAIRGRISSTSRRVWPNI